MHHSSSMWIWLQIGVSVSTVRKPSMHMESKFVTSLLKNRVTMLVFFLYLSPQNFYNVVGFRLSTCESTCMR